MTVRAAMTRPRYKANPGIVGFAFAALMSVPSLADYAAWLGPLLFRLCMLTMFFLFQQGYRALRRRKTQ